MLQKLLPSICFVTILLGSCSQEIVTDMEQEEPLSNSLIIHDLVVNAYEDNIQNFELKSVYMAQSSDGERLEFHECSLEKFEPTSQRVEGRYQASNALYFPKKNYAKLENTMIDDYNEMAKLTATYVSLDFSDYTLSGNEAKIVKQDQIISGNKIFYDLITHKIELVESVKGMYDQS